jgi:hypothetical protein
LEGIGQFSPVMLNEFSGRNYRLIFDGFELVLSRCFVGITTALTQTAHVSQEAHAMLPHHLNPDGRQTSLLELSDLGVADKILV